ncbi:MAG: PAS domain-containing sensor histidine kinase [Thermoanaerobaculia bacterium]
MTAVKSTGIRVDERLAEAERKLAFYEDVLRSLPAGLIITDEQERIVFCNPLADRIRGVGQRVGRSVAECHPERSRKALGKVFDRFRSTDEARQHPLVIERANGWRVQYARIGSPEGEFRGVVWMAQDVRRQKVLEEQLVHQEKLSGLGRMAAKLAHEVKNPLNIIAGAVHNLTSRVSADPASREMLEIVSNQLGRLGGLIDHLREVTRPLRPNPQKTDVGKLLRETLRPSGSGVRLTVPPSLPEVNLDPELFRRLVNNGVENAVWAAGPRGRVTLEVSMDTKPEGEWLEIEIRDDGPGFPQAVFDHLFEPFVTTRPDGTGLGLVIMREVCRLHGGDLEVSNPPEGGARVVARLVSR